jgi:hypothetical protein
MKPEFKPWYYHKKKKAYIFKYQIVEMEKLIIPMLEKNWKRAFPFAIVGEFYYPQLSLTQVAAVQPTCRPMSRIGGLFTLTDCSRGGLDWPRTLHLLTPHTTFAEASGSLNSSLSLPGLYTVDVVPLWGLDRF